MECTIKESFPDQQTIREILTRLQKRIGPQRFNAWFRHGTRMDIDNGLIKVAAPNLFVANWIETHFSGEIAAAAESQTGESKKVLVTIDPSLSGELRKNQLDSQAKIVSTTRQGRSRPRKPLAAVSLKYTLDDFVIGASNKLAYSAAKALTAKTPPPFNTLFVHGTCGVGKTHLLQGICRAFSKSRKSDPQRWRYVTGEQFTNDFVRAIREKKFDRFRNSYRGVDLLAIDDIHFLAAKKATQDEFLHTFNAISSAGKRIVMASDTHPKLLGGVNQQLTNRFIAGMVVKIAPPEKSIRIEILRRKSAAMRLKLDENILEYIASSARGSVRELEGALIKLAAVAAIQTEPLDIPQVARILAEQLARSDGVVTLGDIEATVTAYFGITPADIHSSRRTKTVSAARMLAMYLARKHTSMSYPEIGKYIGKNHSSVVLGVQRMEKLLARGAEISWSSPAGTRKMPAGELADMLSEQLK